MRVRNKSIISIDNIFINPSRLKEYSVIAISNGLSDHDAQLLTIRHKIHHDPDSNISTIRKFNNHIIPEFIYQLSNESWNNVFNSEDINEMFNSFFNEYLKIYNSCFPLQTVLRKNSNINNKWISNRINISRNTKRKLYLNYRLKPNEETKNDYKLYSKILTNVIKEAKKKL